MLPFPILRQLVTELVYPFGQSGDVKVSGSPLDFNFASVSRAALLPIIEGKVLEGSTIYSDCWKAYDGLILNGYDHYRVYHSSNELVRGESHINGIEAFWPFDKRRLAQFNGIREDKFILHLAECQFRYNNRNKNLMDVLVNEYAILV